MFFFFRRMSKKAIAILGLVILCIALLYVIHIIKKPTEGFFGLYDYLNGNRDGYIRMSQQKYNKLSDTMDVTRGNFTNSDDPMVIDSASQEIQQSLATSDSTPSEYANTLLGIQSLQTTAELSPPNMALQDAKKCEALRSRATCDKLGTPIATNCGVCIAGGTPYTYTNPNKHIGGMLVLPEDIAEANASAKDGNSVYVPTIGSCPPGSFFVEKEACKKAVNRQNCKEAGETGGFNGGKTIEGIDVISTCAQVPVAGADKFIYEPKTRTFSLKLRALTPTGTGICKIWVKNAQGQQVGYGENPLPGTEFTITITNAKEGDSLTVIVATEAPYRNLGKSEVFQISSGYNQTQQSAAEVCRRNGASQANEAQVVDALTNGAQVCSTGCGSDFVGWPTQAIGMGGGCGGGKKLNTWSPKDAQGNKLGGSWCYGVKPPQSTNQVIPASILHWFESFGANSDPSQADQPNIWSRYGSDYQAPFERAILLQWEMANGVSNRSIAFEPTIMQVNNQGPSSTTSDGGRTFKILRRFGTFQKSSIIQSPRPTRSSSMLQNQFWIWGNDPKSQQMQFVANVPGIFLDSFYKEDRVLASVGPLVGDPSTAKLLRVSPCLKTGQAAGKYGIDCLQNLFVSSGGDIKNGKLVKTNGGLSQLNKLGDMDAIQEYLNTQYSIATTGKDATGNKIGSTSEERASMINSASQLMFGFDIATPCEDISENSQGNIVLTPKQGAVDADCLNWLWKNTGSDSNRGIGDDGKNIKNTYVSIGQRYSGLRNNESTKTMRQQYPFQTCQRTGSMAPVRPNGTINTEAVNIANTKGGIAGIQNWYNTIFTNANTSLDPIVQKDAVKQCYGLEKSGRSKTSYVVNIQEGFDTVEKKTEGFWNPGKGYGRDDPLAHAWADGPNVGGGLRSVMKNGQQVILRINQEIFEWGKAPGWQPVDNYAYLYYNDQTNTGQWVRDYNNPNCVFTLVFPEDNAQFQKFCAPRNNMGYEPRRYFFALKNSAGKYWTQPGGFNGGDRGGPTTFQSGEWPNNAPGPSQFFNWSEGWSYSSVKVPYGPLAYATWGVIGGPENSFTRWKTAMGKDPKDFVGGDAKLRPMGPTPQTMDLIRVTSVGVQKVQLDE